MRTIRYLLAVCGLACAVQAGALELGQLRAVSPLGAPLAARIELYGIAAADAARLAFELKPAIGLLDPAARAAIGELTASVALDSAGQPYVALGSRTPVHEPVLEFRLRAQYEGSTRVRHYTLALAPAARATVPPARRMSGRAARASAAPAVLPSAATATVATAGSNSFGPVRAGHSLWNILQQTGLAHGDTAGTIARIVADNPHAFVGGDADKLKVGVMLSLPAARSSTATARAATAAVDAAPQATAPAVTPAAPAAAAAGTIDAAAIDAQTRARLRALEEKFAAIRARYAAAQADAHSPAAAAAPVVDAPPAAVVPKARPAAAVSTPAATRPRPVARPAQQESMASPLVDPLYIAVALAVLLLALAGRYGWRRLHTRRGHGAQATAALAEHHLKQQIAAKAEKRVQLEDEFKRTLRDRNGNGGGDPTAGRAERKLVLATLPGEHDTTIERLADLGPSSAGFEEIETRIAYGQYGEAERLLREVLVKVPHNHRAKLRLTEIYYLDERHDEFVALASEIHRLHRADIEDEDWQRIMRMGKVIAPDSPPFSGPLPLPDQREVS